MWSRLSLRLRLTLLTGLVLTLSCTLLTLISVRNASITYARPANLSSMVADAVVQVSPKYDLASVPSLKSDKTSSAIAEYMERVESREDVIAQAKSSKVLVVQIETPEDVTEESVDLEKLQLIPVETLFTDVDRAIDTNYVMSGVAFGYSSIAYALVFVLGGMLAAWFVAGRALAPVRALSETVEKIDAEKLNARLPVPGSRDEVAKLTQAFNRMLEKLDGAFESQKRFANNAAHELKTPIAAILANLDVLELDGAPSLEECRETLAVTRKNTERMSEMVKDLLTLNARIDARQFSAVDVRALIEELLSECAPQIADRALHVQVWGQATLNGNAALLARAFGNLIQNAARYNTHGGWIEIDIAQGRVSIADTGPGIPPSQLEAIFAPFHCVDLSRSRALGGSGLGLSIARQILERHGVRVTAANRAGQSGAVFTAEWAL